MSVVPGLCVLAAVVFVLAARTYESDLKDAEKIGPAYEAGLEFRAA